MKVHINTDRSTDGYEGFATRVRGVVGEALNRFGDLIAHVEVRLNDDGRGSDPAERRCMLEARLEGQRPVAVLHQATTSDEAVRGAAERMRRLIESCYASGRDPK